MAPLLADHPPDVVAAATGITEADLRAAADLIGGAANWVTCWTMGLNQSVQGTFNTNAICNLHLATGAIGRRGSGPLSLTGQPNAMGGREMGYMGPGLPGQRSVLVDDDRRFVEDVWSIPPGTLRRDAGRGTVDLFTRMAAGEVKACWVICTNPIASMANRSTVIAGLEAAELVITQDPFVETETNAYADIVLPAAMWAEGDGVMVSSERTMTWSPQAVDPPGEALPDWQLIARVACEMGFADAFGYTSAEEVFDEIRRCSNPATGYDLRGVTPERLRTRTGAVAGGAGRSGPQPDPLPHRGTPTGAAPDVPHRLRPGRVPPAGPRARRPSSPTTTTRSRSTPVACRTSGTRRTKTGQGRPAQQARPGPVRRDPPRRRVRRSASRRATRSRSPPGAAGPSCRRCSPTGCSPATASPRSTGTTSTASTPASTPSPTTPSTRSRSSPGSRSARCRWPRSGAPPSRPAHPAPPRRRACSAATVVAPTFDETQRRYLAGFLAGVAASRAPGVPVLPAGAPFAPAVAAWVDGWLAGTYSRAEPGRHGAPPGRAGSREITVLWASQTGNAEQLAISLAARLATAGLEPARAADGHPRRPRRAARRHRRARRVQHVRGRRRRPTTAPRSGVRSTPPTPGAWTGCASPCSRSGDSSYADFCAHGRRLDERLHALGAHRLLPRLDCEPDFDHAAARWIDRIADGLDRPFTEPEARITAGPGQPFQACRHGEIPTRSSPLLARLAGNRLLTGPGSAKEVRELVVDTTGSALTYEAGDSLGIWPANCPDLVDEWIELMGAARDDVVHLDGVGDIELAVRPSRPPRDRPGDARSHPLPRGARAGTAISSSSPGRATPTPWPGGRGATRRSTSPGRPGCGPTPPSWVDVFKRLLPRQYSISSSPLVSPHHIRLTTSVVRYRSGDRRRKGVCSTYLADSPADAMVPVFVQRARHFRPPTDPAAPTIMIGPGTGIAPFLGFLEDRHARGHDGPNWLFFGEQQRSPRPLLRAGAGRLPGRRVAAAARPRVLPRPAIQGVRAGPSPGARRPGLGLARGRGPRLRLRRRAAHGDRCRPHAAGHHRHPRRAGRRRRRRLRQPTRRPTPLRPRRLLTGPTTDSRPAGPTGP